MFPILFQIGSLTIYTYGIFLILAVLMGAFWFWWAGKQQGFVEERLLDLALLSLLGGFLGARLIGLFLQWPEIKLWDGMFSWGGGVVGFLVALSWFLDREGWSFLKIGDLLAPALSVGLTFGYLGLWFGVSGAPGEIIIALLFLLLFGFLSAIYRQGAKTGLTLYLFLILSSLLQLIYKFSRGSLFSLDHLVSLALIGLGVLGLRKGAYDLTMLGDYTRDFLGKMKKILLRKRSRLDEVEDLLEKEDTFADPDRTRANADEQDEADELEGHTLTTVLKADVDVDQKNVEDALERMVGGGYGRCERCQARIDETRLEVNPEARLCVKCAQRREAGA